MERLQKVIAQSGFCSRRKAEQLMLDGRVTVNGEIIKELGYKVTLYDEIKVDGTPIVRDERVYYVLYKPQSVISSTKDDKGRKTVVDLVPSEHRIFPVGRLDYDTTGVLLLTNDGAFADLLTNPKHHVEKEYLVKVEGFVRKEASRRLAKGFVLDGIKLRPVKFVSVKYNKKSLTTSLRIIITEGKNRQIKRMFEAIGHPVIKLSRLRIGCINLDGLHPGEFRLLKPHERKKLLQLVKSRNKE